MLFVMFVNGGLKRPWNVARNVFVHMCRLIRVQSRRRNGVQKVRMTHEAVKKEEGVTDKLLLAMSCVRESGIGCSLICFFFFEKSRN